MKNYEIKTKLELPTGGVIGIVSVVSEIQLQQKMIDDIFREIMEQQAHSLINRIFMEGVDSISAKNSRKSK